MTRPARLPRCPKCSNTVVDRALHDCPNALNPWTNRAERRRRTDDVVAAIGDMIAETEGQISSEQPPVVIRSNLPGLTADMLTEPQRGAARQHLDAAIHDLMTRLAELDAVHEIRFIPDIADLEHPTTAELSGGIDLTPYIAAVDTGEVSEPAGPPHFVTDRRGFLNEFGRWRVLPDGYGEPIVPVFRDGVPDPVTVVIHSNAGPGPYIERSETIPAPPHPYIRPNSVAFRDFHTIDRSRHIDAPPNASRGGYWLAFALIASAVGFVAGLIGWLAT